MSYDLCCLVLGIEEDLGSPETVKIAVESEYSSNSCSRYSEMYPFMTMQRGTWINLINPDPEKLYMGAFGLCDADFEAQETQSDSFKIPHWVVNEDAIYGLVPLIIFEEHEEEFRKIIEYLLDKSPIGKLIFLARFQSENEDIVCGVIPKDYFFKLLSHREILFNVCYVVSNETSRDMT